MMQWSRKSRSLHARGLEGVLKWLMDIKKHSGCSQNEAGPLHLHFLWGFYCLFFIFSKFSISHDFVSYNLEDRLKYNEDSRTTTLFMLEALQQVIAFGRSQVLSAL